MLQNQNQNLYPNRNTKSCCSFSLSLFLFIFGLPLLIIGIVFTTIISNPDKSMTAEVTGQVSNLLPDEDTSTKFEVSYIVDGKEYVKKSNFSTDLVDKGDEVQIRYNPDDPSESAIIFPKAVQILSKSLLYGGAVFVLASLIIVVLTLVSINKSKSRSADNVADFAPERVEQDSGCDSYTDQNGKDIDPWEIK